MSQDYHHHHHHPHQPPPPAQQQQPQPHVGSNIFAYNPNAGFDNRSAEDQSTTTEDQSAGGMNPAAYESAGMLSEMFNFGHGPGANTGGGPPPELLDYRRAGVGDLGGTQDWYGPRQIGQQHQQQQRHDIGDHHQQQQHHHHDHNDVPPHHQQQQQQQQHHQMGGAINAHNSVDTGSMQLFLTNAPPRSPSPPPPPPPPSIQVSGGGGGFHTIQGVVHHHSPTSTTSNNNNNNNLNFWATHPHHHHPHHHMNSNPGELGSMVEVQGLSLSLSSSLQHLEAAKQVAEDSHIMFFNQAAGVGPSSTATNTSSPTHFFKNLTTTPGPQAQHPVILHSLQPVGGFAGPSTSSVGFGSSASTSASLGLVNVLRNSKYAKPAQELLEEFCSVGRGQLKKPKLGRQNSSNTATSGGGGGGGGTAGSSSSPRDPPQLSPADRIEHQRRKVKLLAMLDEVDRRYNHYCEQMQMVVNSFDLVMGYGAAIPYTALAQKAMSRHFRCLKDAVHAQLKHSCELLGEKDPTASSGLTKGETPRLKVLEQSLRQQRAFHQMGMMDQEAWRPQRGLPERSVNILRAWLFEHFLHPYPSDADKHLLARQTGLSRNQVSNWFINARVRLWKPMVEEMYQQEAKDREEDDDDNDDDDHDHDRDEEIRSGNQTSSSTSNTNNNNNTNNSFPTTQHQQNCAVAQNPMPSSSATTSATTTTMLTEGKRSADTMHPTPPDCDPSLLAINRHHHQQQHIQFQPTPPQQRSQHAVASRLPTVSQQAFLQGVDDTCHFSSDDGPDNVGGPTTMIRFGAAAGDVSLTLGLRHSGNAPDQKSAPFPVRDYGSF